MQNRENGLVEIYNRVYNARVALGLKAFKRTPTAPVDVNFLPCVFMHEGVDEIVKHASRNMHGYPARRILEVMLEIITGTGYDVKQIYRGVRSVVFGTTPVVADDTFIREIRTEGPTGYDIPDVVGIRFVVGLTYTDNLD